MFGGEPRLADAATWQAKNHFRADPTIGMSGADRLPQIISHLARYPDSLSETSAEFWKRAIIDCVRGTAVALRCRPTARPICRRR